MYVYVHIYKLIQQYIYNIIVIITLLMSVPDLSLVFS